MAFSMGRGAVHIKERRREVSACWGDIFARLYGWEDGEQRLVGKSGVLVSSSMFMNYSITLFSNNFFP